MTLETRLTGHVSPEAMEAYKAAYDRAIRLGMDDELARAAGVTAVTRSRLGHKPRMNTEFKPNLSRVETCDAAGNLKPEWLAVHKDKRHDR